MQLVPTDPVTLLLRLSCLSFVHLGRSLCKTGLSEKCVVPEVKGSLRVFCSAGALWRIIINFAFNNTLDFEDKCSYLRTQTPFGEGEGALRGGLEGGGSF